MLSATVSFVGGQNSIFQSLLGASTDGGASWAFQPFYFDKNEGGGTDVFFFDQNTGVILIAATNRPDVLDPALLRPGRFDRQVVVDRADVKGRAAILAVHAKNKPLSKEISLETLAKRTPGFSGADLENLLNEAALLAARRNKSIIEMGDCDEAIDRVNLATDAHRVIVSGRTEAKIAQVVRAIVCSGGKAEAWYKDIVIEELPDTLATPKP